MKRLTLILLALLMLLTGCSETKSDTTIFAMDTVMNLKLWGKDAEVASSAVTELLNELDRTWSSVDSGSVTAALNAGTAQLTDRQQAVINLALELKARTGGAFDPHLRALSEAWGFYSGANQDPDFTLPTQAQIDEAIARGEWDLGALIKGYAGQEAAELLAGFDVDRAILNLGGNTQTYGEKPQGKPWIIGIQAPDGGDIVGYLSVTGTMSIVTSGDYQRYFEKDGVTYHHILDPETGYPADSGLRSVTVLCRDGATADALSTALFVMGLEEASDFWRASRDFEAVFITAEGRILATEGASLSGCEYEVIKREN